jgi:hypothetical protein
MSRVYVSAGALCLGLLMIVPAMGQPVGPGRPSKSFQPKYLDLFDEETPASGPNTAGVVEVKQCIMCSPSESESGTFSQSGQVTARAFGNSGTLSATVSVTGTLSAGLAEPLPLDPDTCEFSSAGKGECSGSVSCSATLDSDRSLGFDWYAFNVSTGATYQQGDAISRDLNLSLDVRPPFQLPLIKDCAKVASEALKKCKDILGAIENPNAPRGNAAKVIPTLMKKCKDAARQALAQLEVRRACNPATGLFLCLPKGTRVALGDGTHKNVEDITSQDELLSFNPSEKRFFRTRPGRNAQPTGRQERIDIRLSNGETLSVSETHPIWLADKKGWGVVNVDAAQRKAQNASFYAIEAGDSVIFKSNTGRITEKKDDLGQFEHEIVTVESVVHTGTHVDMFDILDVLPGNSFLANNVLVHNTTCYTGPLPPAH